MSLPIKILLADDHHILRTGLKLLLATQGDFQVVAEASNGQEALEKLASVLSISSCSTCQCPS